MEEILLIGGGGHCKAVIDVIEQQNVYSVAGIIDKKELIGSNVLGYQIIGCDDDLEELFKKYKNAIITVGHIKSNNIRIKLFDYLKAIGYRLPVIISPLAYVSQYSIIEEGSIIMHHALVNAGAKVGTNCIINTKALLEHDSVIEENCHISTSAVVNGGTVVKANRFFGSNATSKEYIQVDRFIKAGSLVK